MFYTLRGDHWQTVINIKCESEITKAKYFLPDNPVVNKNSSFTFDQLVDSRELVERLTRLLSIYINSLLKQCALKVRLENSFSIDIPKEYRNIVVGKW